MSHDCSAHGVVECGHGCSDDLTAYPVFDAEGKIVVGGDGTIVEISGSKMLDAAKVLVSFWTL